MPVNVKWGNSDRTFVLLTAEDPFCPSELLPAIDQAQALLDGVDHPVSTVVDFTLITTAPKGMVSMFPSLATKIYHPGVTGFVVFASTRFHWMVDIFSHLFTPVHLANTLEEAEAMVSEFHARLDKGDLVSPMAPPGTILH